jgi:transposase-like protein
MGEFKSLVAVAVEVKGKGSGRVRFGQIPDTSAKSLEAFVQRVVAPGTQVITDGRQGYNRLESLGFGHQSTTLDGKGKQAAKAVLPHVHLIASLLKRWLLGIHHGRVSKKYLSAYLDEFAFRFNRKTSLKSPKGKRCDNNSLARSIAARNAGGP